MSATINDIVVPEGIWTDLYAASGVSVGTAVTVINTSNAAVHLAISLAAPSTFPFGIPLYAGPIGSTALVGASEVGLWAYSASGVGYINVQG